MSKLVDDIKIRPAKSIELIDPVPLEELLLDDEENTTVTGSDSGDKESQKETRRSRRKRLKSSSRVNRRKTSKNSVGPTPRQKKADAERQQRNKKQLLDRQKMSKQVNQSGSTKKQFLGSIRGSTKAPTVTDKFKPTSVLRPVILGTFGYDEITQSVYDSLHIKRSARRIKLDKQIDEGLTSERMILPPVVNALQGYSVSYDSFFESIDPKSISMYNSALAALGLNVVDGSSATEILYTMIREYANSLISTTSRLDESSSRDIEPGTDLVSTKDRRSENVWLAMYGGYDPIQTLEFADDSDMEVSVKCLAGILAKEILFSYNSKRSGIEMSFPTLALQTVYDKNVLSSPSAISTFKSAGGILFKSVNDGEDVLNYPLEMTQILSDSTTLSAFDFVEGLTKPNSSTPKFTALQPSGETEELSSPYAAILASFAGIDDYINKLFDTSTLAAGTQTDSAAVKLLADTLAWINTSAMSYARDHGSTIALQLAALSEAANDPDVFNRLIIYLAFRQEKLAGYEGGSEFLAIGPSTILRTSITLQRILGSMTGKNKITVVADPQDFTVSPPAGSSSGSESFTQPERRTTLSLTQVSDTTAGTTLEDVFDVSYEDVADLFSDFLMKRFTRNGSAGISGRTSTIEEADIERLFRRTTTLSLFDEMLDYETKMNDMFDSTGSNISVFNDEGRTRYSKFQQASIFLAYTKMCTKLTHFIWDSRAVIYEPLTNNPYSSSKSKASSRKGAGGLAVEVIYRSLKDLSFFSATQSLESYLDNDLDDTTDIIEVLPQIAAVIQGVSQEEEFLSTFAGSLLEFFKRINDDFTGISDSLRIPIGDRTLADMIRDGVIPSRDIVCLLRALPWSLNSDMFYYSGKRVRDNVTSREGFSILKRVLIDAGDIIVPQKPQKIMCVGLPSGFIDKIRFEPAEIKEASSAASAAANDEDYFTVVVEKIDLTDPDISYTKIKKTYSRELFSVGASFVDVSSDFVATPIDYTTAVRKYSEAVVHNHMADYSLKQYADLQLDLDFNELAFPASQKGRKKASTDVIMLPTASPIDKTTKVFLSASNLAYDPMKRNVADFAFYNESDSSISLSKLDTSDNYGYSMFEFLNTYGNIFTTAKTLEQVNDGLAFEKVLCVPVDDDEFKVNLSDVDRAVAAETANRLESQASVGVGVETSEGVDMFTYRVTVELGRGDAE